MTEFLFFNVKQQNAKRRKITLLLIEKKNNTVALIGMNLYRVLFLYLLVNLLNAPAK